MRDFTPKPPTNIPHQPDAATREELADYTGPDASKRVLYINLRFFKYGTNDKAHAAAIFLSLFTAILGFGFAVLIVEETDWAEKFLIGWGAVSYLWLVLI